MTARPWASGRCARPSARRRRCTRDGGGKEGRAWGHAGQHLEVRQPGGQDQSVHGDAGDRQEDRRADHRYPAASDAGGSSAGGSSTMSEEQKWREDFPIQWGADNYVTRREFTKFLV